LYMSTRHSPALRENKGAGACLPTIIDLNKPRQAPFTQGKPAF